MISLIAAQGEDNTAVSQSDQTVVAALILIVNCTTVAWPLVRKILVGKHKDYADLALWLLSCPLAFYKGCLKCCTGRDLDKEEAQSHQGFKSWSQIHARLKKSTSKLRKTDSDQCEKSRHPAWRHGQKRSWQLIAMQANTQHQGALDHTLQEEALDDFFSVDEVARSALAQDLQPAENESDQIRLLRARVAQLEQENLEMARFDNAQRARVAPSLEDASDGRPKFSGIEISTNVHRVTSTLVMQDLSAYTDVTPGRSEDSHVEQVLAGNEEEQASRSRTDGPVLQFLVKSKRRAQI